MLRKNSRSSCNEKVARRLQPLFPLEGQVAFELQSFFPLLLLNIIGCFWVFFHCLKTRGQVARVQHFLEYVLYFHDFLEHVFYFLICLFFYDFLEVCFCFSNYFMIFMSLSCYIFYFLSFSECLFIFSKYFEHFYFSPPPGILSTLISIQAIPVSSKWTAPHVPNPTWIWCASGIHLIQEWMWPHVCVLPDLPNETLAYFETTDAPFTIKKPSHDILTYVTAVYNKL
jgi:hypothetical protein